MIARRQLGPRRFRPGIPRGEIAAEVLASLLALIAAMPTPLLAGQYGQTFSSFTNGAVNLSPAGELFSSTLAATGIRDEARRELQLSENDVGSTATAFRLPDLDPSAGVAAFSAKWSVAVVGEQPLADGFSLSFGALGDLTGAAMTAYSIPQEAGFGIGLSVGVTTYDGNNPGYYVRVNGKVVPGGFVSKPAADWGSLNPQRHFFEVDWHYFNGLTLKVDGTVIFSGLPTVGFVPDVGDRFVFGARTGGYDQQVRIDNVVIVTGGNLSALTGGAPYHVSAENPPFEGVAQAFDGNESTKWLAVASTASIGATLAATSTVRAYTLTSANDLSQRDPFTWNFETGNDGTNWTSRGGQTGQLFVGRFEPRAFLVAAPAANSRFRLNITANNGSSATQLAEFRAWQLTPGPAYFKVFSLADSGFDSLRGALTTAGANAGQALITFASSLAGGTITTASRLLINDADGVAIDACNRTGGIRLSGGGVRRTLNNTGAGRVILRGLTITDGNGADPLIDSSAGGLFADYGTLTDIARCTFAGNAGLVGGGLVNFGIMTVEDSTFEGNTASSQGGGLQNEENLTLIRCTFAGNTCATFGAGVSTLDQLTVRHCTFSGNQSALAGGALDAFNTSVTLENSILAGNTAQGSPQDLNMEGCTITRVGANLVQVTSQAGTNAASGPSPLTVDPLLAPIGDYGGPTRTIPLKRDSPARDASVGSTDAYDQRGSPRSGVPDLGAYESGVSTRNYTAWIWETLPAAASVGDHAAGTDFDGDGVSNAEEWAAETDAGSASSVFHFVSMRFSGGALFANFPTVPGRVYRLQATPDPRPPGLWTNTGDVIQGDGNNQEFGPIAPGPSALRVSLDPW